MSIATLLMAMYKGKLAKVLALAGVGAGLFLITFFQSGSAWSLWFLRLLWGFGVVFTLAAPLRGPFKIVRYGRDGLLARATVSEARLGADRSTRPEIRGRRVVHHPVLGDFADSFTLVAPWAASVDRDATLQLLVAPDQRKTWATLGLENETPA